jgi:hydrogenase nickel incorporation protein HypB
MCLPFWQTVRQAEQDDLMDEVRFIDLKQTILSKNRDLAAEIRKDIGARKGFMVNLMSSPGAGKTTLIVEMIRRLRHDLRVGVIEGDVESQLDADKIHAEGVPAVQLRTGGACHLDSSMIKVGLEALNQEPLDLVIIENIGNLICTAEFDLGASLQVMILSVPEGDDKAIKYPLMFRVSDVLIVSKVDYLQFSDFDLNALTERVKKVNPEIHIFQVSAKTGAGMDEWCSWLASKVLAVAG